MHHKHTYTRKLMTPATALIAVLACLGLAACGGSSSTSTSTTADVASTSTTSHSGTGRSTAMRECLQRNGIALPPRTPGQRGPGGPGGGPLGPGSQGGERHLPNGITRAQLQAALTKCGGGAGFRGGQGGSRRFSSPVYRNALAAYSACMSSNGVTLPTPNTSGKGPVFNTTHVSTSSAQFKAAAAKCRGVLRSAFQRYRQARPGTAGGA